MNTVLKSFVILSMLIIALSAQAQSAADRLYMQGQKLQLTRTISAQNQAIGKFSAAKRAYDSREKKALCDRQIQICKQNIKDLDSKPDPKPKPKSKAKPETYTRKVETFYANGVSFEMVRVEGGTFTMGATAEQVSDAFDWEKPTHQVTLFSYSIGKTEVTQALWQAVMGTNPSRFKGSNLPVERVSWEDCQIFIRKLNAITGKNFRLPSEAEWEFAARGGNKSRGFKYSGSNTLSNVAWYDDNSADKIHPVATKASNELGIYDMSGNVWEWCSDWDSSYTSASQTNPTGPISGSHRVFRGGSWVNIARGCRVSLRNSITPAGRNDDLGLRLAL